MQSGATTEATVRYLAAVAADCAMLLGPGVDVDDLTITDRDGQVVLRLAYHLGPTNGVSEGRGETPVAAHSDLRSRVVEDRIAFAMWAYLDATTPR